MAIKYIIFFIEFYLIYFCKGDDNPVPFITKCKASDSECITSSSQNAISTFVEGISKFHVDKIDPAFIESLDASTPQLTLKVKNLRVIGLKGCHVNKMERDPHKGKIFVNVTCDLELDGNYLMDGKILLLKIQGDGDFLVKIGGLEFNADFDLEEFAGKDGEKYWRVPKYTFNFKILGKSSLHFENLFNGNEVLSQAINSLFDSSPNLVAEEVGGPIIDHILRHTIIKNVNNLFKHVPVKYLSKN